MAELETLGPNSGTSLLAATDT